MTKKDNLYSEVVINESPFYYDDHGRLRVHVLNEAQKISNDSTGDQYASTRDLVRDPVTGKTGPSKTWKISNDSTGLAPGEQTPPPGMELNPDYKDRFSGGQIGTMDMRPSDEKYRPKKPMAPVEKTDMPQPPLRSGVPAKQKPGLGNIIGGIKRPGIGGIARPMPKPIGGFFPGGKYDPSAPNSKKDPGRPIGQYDPSAPNPKKDPGRPIGQLPAADDDRVVIDTALERGYESKVRDMRARPPSNMKRPLPVRGQPVRPIGGRPGLGRLSPIRGIVGSGRNTNIRTGLRGVRPAARAMQKSAPATDYLNNKMNLKTAKMGSDAPQFDGKSKAKRRIMAIAAKLGVERMSERD